MNLQTIQYKTEGTVATITLLDDQSTMKMVKEN